MICKDILNLIILYVYNSKLPYTLELENKIEDAGDSYHLTGWKIWRRSNKAYDYFLWGFKHDRECIRQIFNKKSAMREICTLPKKYWFSSGKNNLCGYFD